MERYRTVISQFDRLKLDVLEIIPDDSIEGIALILHGMQEHKERYRPFMDYLARHHFLAVSYDHRGHGKSVVCHEDLGYFYDETAQAIVHDVHTIISQLKIKFPHLPLFLVAHSMGTLIARCYLKEHDTDIDGMILSGAVYENPMAKAGKMLVDVLARYQGGRHVSPRIAKLVEGSFDDKVEGEGVNHWLSSNADNVDAFNNDPLCGNAFTLNGYQNLLKLVINAYSKKGWHVGNPRLPILFAAGEDDPVIGSPDEFIKMQDFLRERGYVHLHSRLYPDMRHEILNEAGREEVFEDFYHFIKEHLHGN